MLLPDHVIKLLKFGILALETVLKNLKDMIIGSDQYSFILRENILSAVQMINLSKFGISSSKDVSKPFQKHILILSLLFL